MTGKARLNKDKPYSQVRGQGEAKYLQDGHYYNFFGKLCGEVDPSFIPKRKKAAPAKSKPNGKEESKEAILARATDKLGDFGGAGAVPQNVRDVAKENAEALAAEENA